MWRFTKLFLRILFAIIFGLGAVAIIIVAYFFFFRGEEVTLPGQGVDATMQSDITPTVHYRDNFIFDPGPQPRENIQYLTNFTEFIQAKSSFRATFSRPVNVAYRFQAVATLTVRHGAPGGGILLTRTFLLDDAFEDIENTRSIYNFNLRQTRIVDDFNDSGFEWEWREEEHPPGWFDNPEEDNARHELTIVEGNLPGGVVNIHIDEFSEILEDLVAELITGGTLLNASAEVQINFSHTIYVHDYNLYETITRGLTIPLRRDVFSIASSGMPSRTVSGRLDTRVIPESLLEDDDTPDFIVDFIEWIVASENISETFVIYLAILLLPLFIIGFYLCVGGAGLFRLIGRGIRRGSNVVYKYASKYIKDMGSSYDRKINKLMKKYANEVVMVSASMVQLDTNVNKIPEFGELIKLSLFTNHPIFCFRNEEGVKFAEFVVIFEGHTHCYKISDDEEKAVSVATSTEEPSNVEEAKNTGETEETKHHEETRETTEEYNEKQKDTED